jgi:hypothetical protein
VAKYIDDMRIGDEFNLELRLTDLAGSPQNITGYKFWITLKTSLDDADIDAVLQFSSTAGNNVNDDIVGGIAYLCVPSSMTKLIPAGAYFYDVQYAIGTTVSTIVPPVADYKDKVLVVPEVTRAT